MGEIVYDVDEAADFICKRLPHISRETIKEVLNEDYHYLKHLGLIEDEEEEEEK